MNTHMVRMFPSKPMVIIAGVTCMNNFCVDVPSSSSYSFNVHVAVIFVLYVSTNISCKIDQQKHRKGSLGKIDRERIASNNV